MLKKSEFSGRFCFPARGFRPPAITPGQVRRNDRKAQPRLVVTGTVPTSSLNPALPYRNRTSERIIPLERGSNLIKHSESGKGNSFDKTSKFIIRMDFKHLIKIANSLFIFF